jgi:hypothetical protein
MAVVAERPKQWDKLFAKLRLAIGLIGKNWHAPASQKQPAQCDHSEANQISWHHEDQLAKRRSVGITKFERKIGGIKEADLPSLPSNHAKRTVIAKVHWWYQQLPLSSNKTIAFVLRFGSSDFVFSSGLWIE